MVNLSSPGVRMAQLQQSFESLNELSKQMLEAKLHMADKMMKVAVADKVQATETAAKAEQIDMYV